MAQSRWKLGISVIITLAILVLAYFNRVWIIDAFRLLRDARHGLLVAAFSVICLSYLVSSQVFNVVLRSLGYRMSLLRLWATALVAIVISQSVPAGGVGSYAFLMTNFNRRGVNPGQAALIASLETLSYASAMLLVFSFSLLYLALRGLDAARATVVAGLVAAAIIGGAVVVLTRSEATLKGWLGGAHRLVERLAGRSLSGQWAEKVITDLVRGRRLLASRRYDVLLLVLIQISALSGDSLAMLLVLYALGVTVSFPVVLAAFGIALITSTFNVLPGGGGTVEAALVAVLSQFGAGQAAVPAAIIFRLFNFWLLAPVAAACYHWLMHERVTPMVSQHAPHVEMRSNAE